MVAQIADDGVDCIECAVIHDGLNAPLFVLANVPHSGEEVSVLVNFD